MFSHRTVIHTDHEIAHSTNPRLANLDKSKGMDRARAIVTALGEMSLNPVAFSMAYRQGVDPAHPRPLMEKYFASGSASNDVLCALIEKSDQTFCKIEPFLGPRDDLYVKVHVEFRRNDYRTSGWLDLTISAIEGLVCWNILVETPAPAAPTPIQ